MVEQFKKKHNGTTPLSIEIAPEAMVVLALKEAVPPYFEGIPLTIRYVESGDVVMKGTRLGIIVYKENLASCDLI